ncbi:hypothetical protein KCTCHS21_40620 [Cohnella abietis]|uniref:Uncharacterized protein n=1 Tax=Cohnella abietis TaxID=2507935 RepID=A0A3T1D9A5_9BACL|nr:hypothetical protein KCTCHS21_40620 [Cohnella abietis]
MRLLSEIFRLTTGRTNNKLFEEINLPFGEVRYTLVYVLWSYFLDKSMKGNLTLGYLHKAAQGIQKYLFSASNY